MQRLFLCKLSNSVAKRFYVIRFRKYYDVVVAGRIQGRADLSFRSCKRHLFDSFVIEASLYTWRASISFFVAAHARKYDMRSTVGRFCTVNRRNVARKIAIPRRAYYRVSTPRIISCVKPTAGSIRKEYKEVLFEQHFGSFFSPSPSFPSFFFPPPSPLFFSLLFSLTERTTVYILSPMQHARVSDYSKTAHVPGGSGSQPTHLHSLSPPSLSLSLRVYARGTVRRV